MKTIPVLVFLVALSACGPRPGQSSAARSHSDYLDAGDPVRAEILKELTDYYDRMSARDWGAYASHFWPGASITTIWQPQGEPAPRVMITSIPDFVAQTPQGPDSKPIFEERMLDADVRVTGNLAQVWASYKARFGEPGKIDEWTGIDAFTFLKHEGVWKIVGLAFSPN